MDDYFAAAKPTSHMKQLCEAHVFFPLALAHQLLVHLLLSLPTVSLMQLDQLAWLLFWLCVSVQGVF